MEGERLKRRYVYFGDPEWKWLKETAARQGVTISSLLRKAVAWVDYDPADVSHHSLAEDVLDSTVTSDHVIARPFTPAPKPVRKKR